MKLKKTIAFALFSLLVLDANSFAMAKPTPRYMHKVDMGSWSYLQRNSPADYDWQIWQVEAAFEFNSHGCLQVRFLRPTRTNFAGEWTLPQPIILQDVDRVFRKNIIIPNKGIFSLNQHVPPGVLDGLSFKTPVRSLSKEEKLCLPDAYSGEESTDFFLISISRYG